MLVDAVDGPVKGSGQYAVADICSTEVEVAGKEAPGLVCGWYVWLCVCVCV
jgi:hypothetical protein